MSDLGRALPVQSQLRRSLSLDKCLQPVNHLGFDQETNEQTTSVLISSVIFCGIIRTSIFPSLPTIRFPVIQKIGYKLRIPFRKQGCPFVARQLVHQDRPVSSPVHRSSRQSPRVSATLLPLAAKVRSSQHPLFLQSSHLSPLSSSPLPAPLLSNAIATTLTPISPPCQVFEQFERSRHG